MSRPRENLVKTTEDDQQVLTSENSYKKNEAASRTKAEIETDVSLRHKRMQWWLKKARSNSEQEHERGYQLKATCQRKRKQEHGLEKKHLEWDRRWCEQGRLGRASVVTKRSKARQTENHKVKSSLHFKVKPCLKKERSRLETSQNQGESSIHWKQHSTK